jgi:hypothetical protein
LWSVSLSGEFAGFDRQIRRSLPLNSSIFVGDFIGIRRETHRASSSVLATNLSEFAGDFIEIRRGIHRSPSADSLGE